MPSPALQALCAAVATGCGMPEPRQAPSRVDWDEFAGLVRRHRVAPLVQRSGWLEQAGASPAARQAVRERVRRQALRSLQVLSLQREILEVLVAAGADVVVLKGPALTADAYADASAREPGDIDLLAGARDVPIIVRALRPLGLEPRGEPGLGHLTLAKEWIEIEVHWQLFENARLMPVDPSWLRSPRQVETLGLVVPALPLEAHWLYAMVHGLRHGWFRLKWLADVAALAQRHPELTEIEALEAVAPAYRTALATGLLFAEAALGPFLAPRSRAWASAVPGTRLQLRRSWSLLSSDVPESMPLREAIGEALGRLAMSTDARYRLEELRLLLLTAAELRWLRRGIPRMTPARVGYRDLDD